ncbi:MAG: ketoacyl-ACP synthase III [Bacteroidales bacterium]|nr:ketoacyl-ACP synthase III [Bacteroidales bacterium]
MALFSIPRTRIAGIAACVPGNREYTAGYRWISQKERELFIRTVGVETRRVVSKGTTTSDLCLVAARRVMVDLGWRADEIGLLVVVTQTRDYLIPATGGILQDRLGLPHSTIALDVHQGCSGYVYGLSLMGSLMNTTGIRKGLLLVGDISSRNTSYRDKSAYPLFGDAGTATAIELSEEGAAMQFNLEGDGSGYDAILIPDGGIRQGLSKSSFNYKKYGEGIYRNNLQVALDGMKVFNFSLREVVPNVKELLKFAGKTMDSIDYIVFHQANKLINESLRKMLKVDEVKTPASIRNYGNTSSASIPLTMVSELSGELSSRKTNLLLSAFGIGLSWGAVLMETDTIICPEIIEYKLNT